MVPHTGIKTQLANHQPGTYNICKIKQRRFQILFSTINRHCKIHRPPVSHRNLYKFFELQKEKTWKSES